MENLDSRANMFSIIAIGAVVVFSSFSCTVLWYIFWYRNSRLLARITGPVPLPLIGHALKFPDSASIIPAFLSLLQKYGEIVTLIIGFEPSVTITDCDVLEQVLSSNKLIHKSRQYRHMDPWLGSGLLTSGGVKWRKRRKIITPTYHFKILEQFIPIFDANADVLIRELDKVENSADVDVYPFVTLYALDVICETAMGTSINAQVNKTSEYVKSIKEISKIHIDKTFKLHQQFDWLFSFTENYRKQKKCVSVLHEHTLAIIKKRRNELNSHRESPELDDFGYKRKVAFLDLLLQSTVDGEALSDQDIRDEVSTFMFEGHDTTASAISFALYIIAKSKHVQDEIMDEQRRIFEDDLNRMATYGDLQDMKYLEMAIKETLRLYPSVPFYAREAKDDIVINNELTLPKGITVNIFAYGVHRNPKVFPDPETFDPYRFAPENTTSRHPYSYIPFSAGPRNCVGQKFAMLEMKSAISKVIRNFELRPAENDHELELIAEIILKSNNGVRIGLKKRKIFK